MDFSWNNLSQTATGYEIQRKPAGGSWSTIGTVDYADTTEYSDTTPALATQYYYQVLATDGDGNYSAPSNVVTSVTAPSISIGNYGDIGGATEDNAGVEGSLVTFVPTITAATGEADPVSGWSIDWGDGSTPEGSLTHTYEAPGDYTITATTADGNYSGATDTTIGYVPGSLALTDNTDGTYLSGLDYAVTAAFTAAGAEHVNSWDIDWGDGATQIVPVTSPSAANDTQEFTHTFGNGSGFGYSVTISAETSDGVCPANAYVFPESGYTYPGYTISVGPATPPTGYDFGLSFGDATSTDESAHTYTINWGDTPDGSDDSTASVVPGESSGIIGHNYLNTGVYNITVTDADSSDVGGYETNFSAPAPVVTPAYEQVIGPGQTITLASFSGAGANAIAYVNWTGGAGPDQPATVVPDGDGDGGGTITATAPSIPGAYTPSITLYQPDMENGFGFVEYGGGFSADVVTVSSTVDVWGVKIDNGESNDLLIASSDGTQNLQDVTVYFPHPAGEALDLTLTTSDDSEDQVWDPTLGTVGTDAAMVLGKDSSGTLHSSYSFSVGPDVYYKEFEVGATEGDATLNVLSFALSGSADSGASTSTFNTEVSLAEVGNTGASDCAGSQDECSDFGVTLSLDSDPNATTQPAGTDGTTGHPYNWLVGQLVSLTATVTAPPRTNVDYALKIPNHYIANWYEINGNQGATLVKSPTAKLNNVLNNPLSGQGATGPAGADGMGHMVFKTTFRWVSTEYNPATAAGPDNDLVQFTATDAADPNHSDAPTLSFYLYSPNTTGVSVVQGTFQGAWTSQNFGQPKPKENEIQFLHGGLFSGPPATGQQALNEWLGIFFTAGVTTPALNNALLFAPGSFKFVQKIDPINTFQFVGGEPGEKSNLYDKSGVDSAYGPDKTLIISDPMQGLVSAPAPGAIPAVVPPNNGSKDPDKAGFLTDQQTNNNPPKPMTISATDAPNITLEAFDPQTNGYIDLAPKLQEMNMTEKFETYLMYQPPGAGSIWVPLMSVNWVNSGTIKRLPNLTPLPRQGLPADYPAAYTTQIWAVGPNKNPAGGNNEPPPAPAFSRQTEEPTWSYAVPAEKLGPAPKIP